MEIKERKPGETGREYALRVIRENIISLALEPGAMVSEKDLALELGLSRGPVREALLEFSRVKIIETYPQRGNRIALVDYSLIDEARFMRETLEAAVVERCCRNGLNPKLRQELLENISMQQLALEHNNTARLWELDNDFHFLLFFAANVPQVYHYMSSMQIHFDRVRAMALTAVKEIKIIQEHSRILEDIAGGAEGSAKGLMHRHLTRYQIDREAICEKYPNYVAAE